MLRPSAEGTLQSVAWLGTRCSFLALVLCSSHGCAGSAVPDEPSTTQPPSCPSGLPRDDDCAAAAPSYQQQVAGLIAQRCTPCHSESYAQSPQVFSTYEDTYAERRGMLTQIYQCRMPPEAAEPLTVQERGTLLKWFVCDAPAN